MTLLTGTSGYLSFANLLSSMSEAGLLVLWGAALLVVAGGVRRGWHRSSEASTMLDRASRVQPSTQELKVGA